MIAARSIACALLFSLGALQGSRLESKVKRLLDRSPAAKRGFTGVAVVDETGRKLVSINAQHAFTPASNTKLFSTALALERIGPDKRFETRVEQRGDDLFLIGTGDANLSGRVLPYQYDSPPGHPLAVIDELAAQIAARGIHEIAGDIVGDDTAFLYEPYAPGWAAEDITESDGAPVSALVINDNSMTVTLTPGLQDGAATSFSIDPPLPLFRVENYAITGAPQSIRTDRIPGTGLWRIWGMLPSAAKPYTEEWAVDDPALFAASAFQTALEQHGVHVTGSARALHRLPGVPFTAAAAGPVLAQHESLPLVEDLRLTDKVSQNLHADLLLFDIGGSREGGLVELTRFLDTVGIPTNQYTFHDGSGLSRMNLVTPDAVIALLRFMLQSPHAEDWLTFLPVSGVDGSLAARLAGPRVKGRIHAKTGSLNHVSALSGYADTRKGRRLTFSIFVNNATAPVAAQRELIDKICALLVE